MDTRCRILDVAERLAQERGFNAFSYAHVAQELGITKASLHYHFSGKAELGQALIDRYTQRFADELAAVDRAEGAASSKLAAYLGIYEAVLRERRMCLCGMLAADYETLPPPMCASVVRFFDMNEQWLTSLLVRGEDDGSVHLAGPAHEVARAIISGLEGAMLVARPYQDASRFRVVAVGLLRALIGAPASVFAAGSAARVDAGSDARPQAALQVAPG